MSSPPVELPRILRKETPPRMRGRRGYLHAREHLRRDFANRCAYCLIHETQMGGSEGYWIDHFQPVSRGGALNDYANLYWSCIGCNHIKSDTWPESSLIAQGYRFADPCREQDYGVHFIEDENGKLVALTPCGEYHILYLRLNRDSRVKLRRDRAALTRLIEEGITLVHQMEQQMTTPTEKELLQRVIQLLQAQQEELAFAIPFIPTRERV